MNIYFVYYESQDGRILRKPVKAQNKLEAQKELEKQGWKVVEVTQGERRIFGFFQRNPTQEEVAQSTRQLGILLKSGIPLLKALSLLQRNAKPSLWWIFNHIQDEIKAGASFSDALENHPQVFDIFYINMVRSAEESGHIEEVLEKISSVIEFRIKMRKVLFSAIAYPAFILFFSLVTTLVMSVIFAPRIQIFYRSLHAKMPWVTEQFAHFGTVLSHHILSFVLVMVISGCLFFALLKWSFRFQTWIKIFLFHLPLIGQIYNKSEQAKIVWALGDLSECGIPIFKALTTASKVTTLPRLQRALDQIAMEVNTGKSLSDSLENSGAIDSLIISLASTGEEAGALGKMLLESANILRMESEQMAEKAGAILQPALLLFSSLVVAFVLFNFYYPMFNILSKIR